MVVVTKRQASAVLGLLGLCSCLSSEPASLYPAADFRLEIEYRVVRDVGVQVLRRVAFDAKGVVTVREAERSLRSTDGSVSLPVFGRLCVYRLHPMSIRWLAQSLARRRVKDMVNIPGPEAQSGELEVIQFDLVYDQNKAQLVGRGGRLGQLRDLLRLANSYLPAAAAFPTGDLPADLPPSRVRAVPPFCEVIAECLAFHRDRSDRHPDDDAWRRDTLALACAAGEWGHAQQVLGGLKGLSAADRLALQEVIDLSKGEPAAERR